MFTTIIWAIATIAGGVTIYNNWTSFKKWFNDFVSALSGLFSTVCQGVAYATSTFIRVLENGMAEIVHQTYVPMEAKNEFGEINTRRLTKIPAWAKEEIEREQENGKSVRVTKDMAQRLGLTI